MPALLLGDRHPVVIEAARHALLGEASQDVGGEIDGVQLDVGERVEQRDAALGGRADAPARYQARRQQLGA